MKHDARRIVLATIIPLFILFILYLLKFLEVGMGCVRHLRPSVCAWQLEALAGQHAAAAVLVVVPVLLLSAHSFLHLLCDLDWLRSAYFSDRETGMAHRSQWNHLRTCIFPVLQRHFAEACTVDCYILISNIPLRRTCLEHVPLLRQGDHFVGRAS